MSPRRAILAAVVLLALAPASASARTIQEDLDAAQAYWGSPVCAGQWQVIPDTTLPSRGNGGEATGIGYTWNGTDWDWYVDRCEFTMDPQYQGCQRAAIVRHEVGHIIVGPTHTGPMAPGEVDNEACPIRPQTTRKPRAKVAKRR